MTLDVNRVKSPGRRLVAAFVFAAAGLGLAGCGSDSTTSGPQIGGPGQQAVGTVSGVIVDNNGNPINGATVYTVGNAKAARGKDAQTVSATTNAGGFFTITNVPVVNVTNNNGTDTGQSLALSVVPPAGFLGATLHISPQAQVTSSESGSIVQGGETNPAVLWFDHFNASVGTVPLPATNATITGTLRNATTGTARSGVTVALDFTRFDPDQTIPGTGGSQTSASTIVSYAAGGVITTVTGTDGTFTFTNVPADSCLRLYGPGYLITASDNDDDTDYADAECNTATHVETIGGIAISTNDENLVQLNQIFAAASPNADTIAPYVVSVDNASYVSGPCGTLSSVAGDTLVIHFSEPVNVAGLVDGLNPVTVLIGAFPNFTFDTVEAAVLSADKTTLTLTLADPLPTTADVTIDIPVEDVADLSGNALVAGPAVAYDSIHTVENGESIENVVDQLCFNTFAPGQQPSGTLTVTQVDPAQNADGGPDSAALNLLFDSTSSLIDIIANGEPGPAHDDSDPDAIVCFGATTGTCTTSLGLDPDDIDQLNAFQDNPRVGTQLDNLAEALNGSFVDVHTHVARVHLNVPTNTVNFAVALIDPVSGLPKDALFFPIRTAAGGGNPIALGEVSEGKLITSINNGGAHWYSIAPGGATEFDIAIAGNFVGNPDKPNPGDIFVAIARGQTSGGTFVLGPAAQITLQDNVGPTVALQLLGCNPSGTDDCATQGAAIFGQGGVVVNEQSSATGTVVLNVTPQAGDTSEAHTAGNNGTFTGYYGDDFTDELYRTSGAFANGAVATARYDTAGQLRALTDATGTDVYLTGAGAANARVAIDVVEHVTVGPGALPASPTGGSSALSNYVAINSVNAENSTGCDICNDEVQFTVSRIVGEDALGGARAATFQNDAIDNDIIDLTGGITDLAGNTADDANNARVVMQDKFPPLVVEAFNDGFNTFIRFNEPILQEGSITFIGCGADGDGNPSTILLTGNASVTLSADGLVLQIPSQGVDEVYNPITAGCFSPTTGPGSEFTYAESIYTNALVTAIAANVGATVSTTSFPDAFQHAEIGYRDVPDAQGNIWDCSANGPNPAGTGPGDIVTTISGNPAEYCGDVGAGFPDDATFVWAGAQLGMAGPSFEVANILGPFELRFQAVGFANNSTAATFTITGTHPIGNWFTDQSTVAPNPVAELFPDLDPLSGANTAFCTVGTGTLGVDAAVTCTYQFVDEWLAITGACTHGTAPAQAATNATLSADQKVLTIHIACDAGNTIATGDTATLSVQTAYNGPGAAPYDTARSLLDGETQSPVSHQFNAN
jgi:hypothetical protein